MKTKQGKPKAPTYLRRATGKWWRSVLEQWALEQHHIRLLTLAASAWDRAEQARELLAEHGLTYSDPKTGRPCSRPEVAIERDSRLAFARLIRELDLDLESPKSSSKPPSLRSIVR